MERSRVLTGLVGLAAGLAISVVAWVYFDTLALFVFLPLVPFLFWRGGDTERPPVRECPVCEFRTRNPEFEYCPRDGHRLESSEEPIAAVGQAGR